jgi:hypothetical protein
MHKSIYFVIIPDLLKRIKQRSGERRISIYHVGISNSYFIINRKIANLNVIISTRVELSLNIFSLFFSTAVSTGNLNGKWVKPYTALHLNSYLAIYLRALKCCIPFHKIHRHWRFILLPSRAPSQTLASRFIILYDWKIFLLDAIDGTLETDAMMIINILCVYIFHFCCYCLPVAHINVDWVSFWSLARREEDSMYWIRKWR